MNISGEQAESVKPCPMALEDVHFVYPGGVDAVRGVTATLTPGKLHVLLGPNACGKTTLLKLLLGVLTPTRGEILLEGLAVGDLAPGYRARRLSYVPQQTATSFAFSIEQVVQMGQLSMEQDSEVIERVLAQMELDSLRDRAFSELSAGQQQRVLLARAMAQVNEQSSVMLLDEPISAMDLRWIHRTMAQLIQLTRRGLAVLVVLHDLNLAMRYAEVVWLMDQGKMVTTGPWQQVLRPEVLEPIYGVKMSCLESGQMERPLLVAVPCGSS